MKRCTELQLCAVNIWRNANSTLREYKFLESELVVVVVVVIVVVIGFYKLHLYLHMSVYSTVFLHTLGPHLISMLYYSDKFYCPHNS